MIDGTLETQLYAFYLNAHIDDFTDSYATKFSINISFLNSDTVGVSIGKTRCIE